MAFDMEEQFSEECVDSGIHEECGVFGAYDFDGYQRPEKEHSGS